MHMGPDAERLRIAAQANQNVRLGARRAPSNDSPLDVLRRLLKATPLTVDLDELALALKNAEAAKVPAFELKKGIAKMEYAERVQTAARIKAFAAEVEVLLTLDDLDVDVEKLLEMIEFAEDKPGVPEGLIAKAEAKLQSAEEAQERRRQEIRAAATAKITALCNKPLMLLDEIELTAAAAEAVEADVADDLRTRVHEMTRAAARRSAALSNLNYLATAEPFELNTGAMRAAMAEASEAGVPMTHVKDAQFVLRNAEQQQAARNAAEKLLHTLTDKAPLEIEIEPATRAVEDAVHAEVSSEKVMRAKAAVAAATAAQEKRDAAAATMVLAAAPQDFSVAAVEKAVAAAKAAGVTDLLVEACEAKYEDGQRKSIAEIKALAAARAIESQKKLKEASDAAAKAYKEAKAKTNKLKDVAEVTLQTAQMQVSEAVRADEKVLKALGLKDVDAAEDVAHEMHPQALNHVHDVLEHPDHMAGIAEDEEEEEPEDGAKSEPLGNVHEQSKEEEDDEHDYIKELERAPSSRGSVTKKMAVPEPAAPATPEALWAKSMEEREKVVAAEARATDAWAAFEEAVHAEHVAEREMSVAAKKSDWADKEANAYDKADKENAEKLALAKAKALAAVKPRAAPKEVQKEHNKQKQKASGGKGGGGCCGKKVLEDVLEVDVIDVHEKPPPPAEDDSPAEPPKPQLVETVGDTIHGLDGLSWAPIWCQRAPNKVELLKGLALEGSYTNETICEAVAMALSAVDPQTATGFVRELSQALPSLPTAKAATLGMVADTWLSKVVLDLVEKSGTMVTAGETVFLVVESVAYVFTKTLRSLLEAHFAYTNAIKEAEEAGKLNGGSTVELSRLSVAHAGLSAVADNAEIDMATKAKIADLHTCIAHMLGSSMHSRERFVAMLPVWTDEEDAENPSADAPAALAATATHFAHRIFLKQKEYKARRDKRTLEKTDKADERVILALIGLFVEQSGRLVGFQQLVPRIFDTYLAKDTALREELNEVLKKGGAMSADLIERIKTDDQLVSQPFFWSAAGMKLFGGGDDLKDEAKLRELLEGALAQQPAIVLAWLQQIIGQISSMASKGQTPTADGALGLYMKTAIVALGSHVQKVGVVEHSTNPNPDVNDCVGILLEMATRYREAVYEAVLAGCVASSEASVLIDAFAANFREHIGIAAHSTRLGHKDIIHTHIDAAGHARLSRISMAGKGHHHAGHHVHHPPPKLGKMMSSVASGAGGALGRLSVVKTPDELCEDDEDAPKDERMSKLLDVHTKLNGIGALKTPSKTMLGGSRASMASMASLSNVGGSSTDLRAPKMSAVERLAASRASRASHAAGASATGAAAKKGMTHDPVRDEMIIQTLASLFVAAPAQITAFAQLVPKVFESHLKLGTPQRDRLNKLMLEGKDAFDPALEHLLCNTDELMGAPFFWHADVVPLCTTKRIQKSFSTLAKATLVTKSGETINLFPRLLALLLRLSSAGANSDPSEIARRTVEVLDQFERNVDQQQFIMTIFNNLEERTKETPEQFADIPLTVLSEVAANGVQTISSVQGDGMELCEQAMTTLLKGYMANEPPTAWKKLFKEATNIGFMVKYMFRESLEMAKEQFTEFTTNANNFKKMPNAKDVQKLLQTLLQLTLQQYGEVGIFDPEKLAEIDFLNQPQLLVDLVAASKNRKSREGKDDMQLLTTVTTKWMEFMIEKKFPPLTPHHTQAFIVMMMARFFGDYLDPKLDPKVKAKNTPGKLKLKAFVAQMSTGEGKSIVIAMCAIFMVKLYGLKVHVLENNEGLLERDYATNAPFYERFGIKSGKDLGDKDAQIIYTLKAGINKHFLRGMVAGELELDSTVLIVDEVDDLIVNERPNAHYVKVDVERTPALVKSLAALKLGEGKPADVPDDIWAKAQRDMNVANAREENVHYRVIVKEDGKKSVIQLNNEGQVPKVPLTSPWLKALQYKLCGDEPTSDSHFACVCTPYVFNMYAGIFGLTGSVGGKAELGYLTKTYSAVKFDAPRFLDTCKGNARKVVLNHGVELMDGPEKQIARVVELAHQYFKQVPVLIIAASSEELTTIHKAVQDGGLVPADEVQRFSEFDAAGVSMKNEWQTIIDDATKRLGGQEDNRCRVTITDRFGGRGHDFQVVDKEANANGGMLVIATSVPDEREWIQWKGRTARQDRPGQFYVILDKKSKALQKPGLLSKVQGAKISSGEKKGQPDHDARIEMLLDCADEGIGDKLIAFEKEQLAGEKLNEVAVKYFKQHPRDFDAAWPSDVPSDKQLRHFMTSMIDADPAEIKKEAKAQLGIVLD